MSFTLKKKEKEKEKEALDDTRINELCDIGDINKLYSKKCGNNKKQLETEELNRTELGENPNNFEYLYPDIDDPSFNIKIAQKKEFSDTKYDGTIYSVEDYANILSKAEYELLPHQAFVRNFLSFHTPYNSLLLFHGLGSGKTCSAIGVCEEMRDYLRQMGINKHIIIVASPNVQDNFKLQLFDERKLKEVDGIWTMKGCLGNKLLKEINPTGMKGLKRDKVIQQVKNVISSSYSFQGYLQFSNEIVRKSGNTSDTTEQKIKNLQNEYSDSLIVIDEVHNIRISDDNENKSVAKNLLYLVSVVSNLRLLLLSATPMFNSYKEIVWLLNLMNMNDKRGIISVSDVFDKNGNFKMDNDGNQVGKDLLIRKASGYVSYVRGENPYTFPFRVYPNKFAPNKTFKNTDEYPLYQINGKKIPNDKKVEKIILFLTRIGEYQSMGYNYITDKLRKRGETTNKTRSGKNKKVSAFSSLKSFGYTDLQIPIEALNIIYPYDGLDELTKDIEEVEFDDELEEELDDISPLIGEPDKEIIESIDDVMNEGPQLVTNTSNTTNNNIIQVENSELESEPMVTEGIEADEKAFDNVEEKDTSNIPVLKKKLIVKSKNITKRPDSPIFEIIDDENNNTNQESNDTQMSFMSIPLSSLNATSSNAISSTSNIIRKTNNNYDKGQHIIEGNTKSYEPETKNTIRETNMFGIREETITSEPEIKNIKSKDKLKKGGDPSSSPTSLSSSIKQKRLYIDPKELTGGLGLRRIMDYVDTKTPAEKGSFEYKKGVTHVFDNDEIGNYSAKIKTICDYIYNKDTKEVSDGIILIYSSYIDGGIVPMALALEEMGFTRFGKGTKSLFKNPPVSSVDSRTMKPPTNKADFYPAKYCMITGDPRLSPNNDYDVKALTNDNNILGNKIKVVLISQAGSEGIDLKAIRQIHIMEPWYNINRTEQILGRGVRNFSHKDLPFEQRNVQIFLYGTILDNPKEEAADLYIYRISEIKAVKIGKVTRLLKQTAVDCVVNDEQINFTVENFNKIKENRNIVQKLSDHQELKNFEVGDIDESVTCDFMECEFKCLPEIELDESKMSYDTYSEAFMLVNSDKIIQKIKKLFQMRFFYKKNVLIQLLNVPKKYPLSQIYSALTQIISDNTEYIIDGYGRTGYLVNIGDYYLFQPSELNYKNISLYERSVPINYKHNMIKFEIKTNISKRIVENGNLENDNLENDNLENGNLKNDNLKNDNLKNDNLKNDNLEKNEVVEQFFEGKIVLDSMFDNYKLAIKTNTVIKGNHNWYEYCGIIIRKMSKEDIISSTDDQKRTEILEEFLIEHIVDSLMMNDKINLLNYLNINPSLETFTKDVLYKRFLNKSKIYLFSKFILSKGITGLVIFDGPSRTDNLNIFVLNKKIANNKGKWVKALPEDKKDLEPAILKKYKIKGELNSYVGFIGFENNKKYMVYKLKNTINKRSTGFRCDQAGKEKVVAILNSIRSNGGNNEKTKEGSFELCVRQEFTLRNLQREENEKLNGDKNVYFLDTETAIINEFEKKEKI